MRKTGWHLRLWEKKGVIEMIFIVGGGEELKPQQAKLHIRIREIGTQRGKRGKVHLRKSSALGFFTFNAN